MSQLQKVSSNFIALQLHPYQSIYQEAVLDIFNSNCPKYFITRFNDVGEIIQMQTQRYMDDKNLETGIIKLAAFKEINEVVVPTAFEVLWRLKKGDFSYAKFNLQQIDYNKPLKFEAHEIGNNQLLQP